MSAVCSVKDCGKPADVAIKTQDSGLRGLISTVHYEPGRAPKGADPQCWQHGSALLSEMVRVLTGNAS
jgi:hypothetical protein